MSVRVEVLNRQRRWTVDTGRLREVTEAVLVREFGLGEALLGVQLIGATAMAAMNWRWLRHEGSTDILTFDHREDPDADLHGELFVSVDDAVVQAGEFHADPSVELFRYVVHGILHLRGYGDAEPAARRVMKRIENRVVRRWSTGGAVRGLLRGRGRRARRIVPGKGLASAEVRTRARSTPPGPRSKPVPCRAP